jgi:hypothetical protein
VTTASARILLLALAVAGCASSVPLDTAIQLRPGPPAIRFGVDTFAFANESRSRNWEKPDLFANYCFVMTRAVVQFQRFARFAPGEPRLAAEEYTERVRRVVGRAPWRAPLPPGERVVIPGYASLFEFSRAQEPAIKAGLGSQLWSFLHWSNWRVAFPTTGGHQESVAADAITEIRAGRPVPFLITNFPTIELNHGVLAYDYRVSPGGTLQFTVYDPNDAARPGLITFDPRTSRFEATRLFDTTPGGIRAFRMSYSPLL